jgi:hypothetical protein
VAAVERGRRERSVGQKMIDVCAWVFTLSSRENPQGWHCKEILRGNLNLTAQLQLAQPQILRRPPNSGFWRVTSRSLNLDPHFITPQPRRAHRGSNRLAIGRPLRQVPHRGLDRLGSQRYVVRVDAEDLRPALAPASLRFGSTLAKAWLIWAVISL